MTRHLGLKTAREAEHVRLWAGELVLAVEANDVDRTEHLASAISDAAERVRAKAASARS